MSSQTTEFERFSSFSKSKSAYKEKSKGQGRTFQGSPMKKLNFDENNKVDTALPLKSLFLAGGVASESKLPGSSRLANLCETANKAGYAASEVDSNSVVSFSQGISNNQRAEATRKPPEITIEGSK